MAAAATAAAANKAATATLAPPKPMPPSERRRLEAAAKQKGLFRSLGDGLRNLANAPNAFNGAAQAREQSEFTARAQRERELLAQVAEAQEYARLEQKKRQQLEAAYQSTRNALKEAQTAREGLKAQESLSAEMKSKMTALEKALNDRDVAAASGVFGGDAAHMTALTDRVRALETALATASAKSNGPGDAAAVAALTHLQEKVRMLEHAFSERNATADAAAAAVTKVDQLAAQVQKDAAAVPELQKQMVELRETIARTPGAAAAGGTMAVEANLKEMTERMRILEESLAKVHENPMSLDVLYAKVGAVEEGLAATANGSSNLIQELQQKMQKLEGAATAAPGMGVPVQAPGMNNVVKNFPPPPAPAQAAPAAPATPKREPKPPPGFNPPVPPKPAEPKPAKLPPAFTPSIEIKDGAPGPRHAPGLGREGDHRGYPGPCPGAAAGGHQEAGRRLQGGGGDPPQDCHRAGGDDAGIQLGVAQVRLVHHSGRALVGDCRRGLHADLAAPLHGLARPGGLPAPQPPLAQQQIRRRGRASQSHRDTAREKHPSRAGRGAQPPLRDAPGRGWEVEHVEGLRRHGLG